MKANVTKSEDEGHEQEETDGVTSVTIHDDGTLILRTNNRGIMYERDEWTAMAVQKEES